MMLSQWLSDRGETQAEFGARPEIGAHYTTVCKWVSGVMMPRPKRMAAIERVTQGAVRANDFYASAPAATNGEQGLAA